MADADRVRWNERYRERAYDFTPAGWLTALEDRLRPPHAGARALDLACGGGRNALYLARLGYHVDAWDISDVALAVLRAELDRLRGAGEQLDVTPRQVDLKCATLPTGYYDVLLNAYFLERSLFPAMQASLRPGGLLVFQTFLHTGTLHKGGRTTNPAYLLGPGELRAAFPRLETLEYIEDLARGEARLIARRGPRGLRDVIADASTP